MHKFAAAIFPDNQVAARHAVKAATNLPTTAVGIIRGYDQAEAIIGTGDADFVAAGAYSCLQCDAGGRHPATDDREREQWRGAAATMALSSPCVVMCA